jgi:hypothetical protein
VRPPLVLADLAVAGSIPGRDFFNFPFSSAMIVACSIVALNYCRSSNANYFLISNNQPRDRSQVNRQSTFLHAPTVCMLAVIRHHGQTRVLRIYDRYYPINQQNARVLLANYIACPRGRQPSRAPRNQKRHQHSSVSRLLRHLTRCYIYCYQQLVQDR